MISRRAFVVLSVGVAGATGSGQQVDRLPEAPFGTERGWTPMLNGKDLTGWHAEPASRNAAAKSDEWFATSSVSHSPNAPEILTAGTDSGSVVLNGRKTHSMDLISDRKFGDHELYLEFMVARGSISGVFLHGLYEVQIADSFS